jgi:cysteinyl-tRNA synthetase
MEKLFIYDSKLQKLLEFMPIEQGKISMYVCGATTQGKPHIGHLRTNVSFDQIRRWLEFSGYEVSFIQNVTDIDDKILAKERETGQKWFALGIENERHFDAASRALNVIPPTYNPRATGHITEIRDMIERIISNGHAYITKQQDVYFDTFSYPEYGELTNQKLDEIESEDTEMRDKKHSQDFALWKAKKSSDPDTATWDAGFSKGRPGWHIECSAMSTKYLGDSFDIHGGGIDLRFPHHENELAQAKAAGCGFANHWIHTAWVTQKGEKMSKSLGNYLSFESLLKRARDMKKDLGVDVVPAEMAIRYALSVSHYRSQIEWSDDLLKEAFVSLNKIFHFVENVTLDATPLLQNAPLPNGFADAMNDDFNTPRAFASIFNEMKSKGEANELKSDSKVKVLNALNVLGLLPKKHYGADADTGKMKEVIDMLVKEKIALRNEAKQKRDWQKADEIRDYLNSLGIKLADTKDGTDWGLL